MFLIKIGVAFSSSPTNAFKMKYFITTSAGLKKQANWNVPCQETLWFGREKIEIWLRETSPHWREICPASGAKFCPVCKEITIFPRLPICTPMVLSLIHPPKCCKFCYVHVYISYIKALFAIIGPLPQVPPHDDSIFTVQYKIMLTLIIGHAKISLLRMIEINI